MPSHSQRRVLPTCPRYGGGYFLQRADVPPSRPRSAGALAHRFDVERAPRKRSKEFGFRLSQVNPGGPIVRTKHDNLPVMIRDDVRSGCCRQHRKRWRMVALPWPPNASDRRNRRAFQREAVLRLRVLLAGEFEKSRRGNEATLLLSKCRPSDRKLKIGAPPGRPGGKLKVMGTSSTSLPAARITGPVSLILRSSACGRSSSLCWLGMPSSRACIILQYSAQRTCCS
jgi:hypothetical protein